MAAHGGGVNASPWGIPVRRPPRRPYNVRFTSICGVRLLATNASFGSRADSCEASSDCLNRAVSARTGGGSGRTGVWAKAVIPYRRRSSTGQRGLLCLSESPIELVLKPRRTDASLSATRSLSWRVSPRDGGVSTINHSVADRLSITAFRTNRCGAHVGDEIAVVSLHVMSATLETAVGPHRKMRRLLQAARPDGGQMTARRHQAGPPGPQRDGRASYG
jgi:hypothetical protein